MDKLRKLPDAEFEIMKVVWSNEPPITTSIVMRQFGDTRGWTPQAAISLLLRLVERGFLRTEKLGKERTYFPLVTKEEYFQFETEDFLKRFHNNSFLSMVSTMYNGKELSDGDVAELLQWAKDRGK